MERLVRHEQGKTATGGEASVERAVAQNAGDEARSGSAMWKLARGRSTPEASVGRSLRGATSMIQRTGGESPNPGPDGGNPTLTRQGHRCGAPRLWRRDANVAGPARGCLVEVIGARPDRAKAKRRKATALGEPAPSGEAQYPYEARVYWRRGGREVVESYLVRSAGFRGSGSRHERKNEEQ